MERLPCTGRKVGQISLQKQWKYISSSHKKISTKCYSNLRHHILLGNIFITTLCSDPPRESAFLAVNSALV